MPRSPLLRAFRPRPVVFLFAVLTANPVTAQDEDPARLLRSRDVEDRLMGIFLLERDRPENAEKLLLGVVGDRDWEVMEEASRALGELKSQKALPVLVDIATKAPARRVRLAAARAIAAIDADAGADALARKVRGDRAPDLVEMLGVIGGPRAVELLQRYAEAKDPELARSARLALGAAGGAGEFDLFIEMLAEPDLLVRLAGVRGLGRTGEDRAVEPLLEALANARSDVEERRVRRAIVETLRRGAAFETLADRLQSVGPRHVRLLADIAGDELLADRRDACARRIASLLDASAADIRAAAAHALGAVGDAEHADPLSKRATSDEEPRVRLHALRALVGLKPDAGAAAATRILERDPSPDVLEDAAALCGIHRLAGTEDALLAALQAETWQVAAAAAISLGKLRHLPAREALGERLSDRDWRLRGAAALALAWLRDAEATDLLIERLGDRDESVRNTILHALQRITGQMQLTKKGQWQAWWKKNREGVRFIDRERDRRQAEMDGYSPGAAYTFYEDLDVVSILSPRPGGDHIEELLARYKIKHRLARAGEVGEAGLHPFAIAVSNCSGEILPEDIERVEWFVRCGGYLFASCWSLTETVGKAFPGIARMHPTPAQVLDEVPAEPVTESGVMRGVLRPGTRTRYVLEGSHLISVIDKERFEVLIDSPQCAARWGEGNLAGWFTVGHGLVFDSANHFDLQGMKRDMPRSAKERRAMAMDVLGYDHDELRDFDKSGVFKSEKKCMAELEDLSMFRLVTNFVLMKRRAEL